MTSDQASLIEIYYLLGLTTRQLSKVVKTSHQTIATFLKSKNIKLRTRGVLRKSLNIDTHSLLTEFTEKYQSSDQP